MKKIMTAILVGFILSAAASVFADSNAVAPPSQYLYSDSTPPHNGGIGDADNYLNQTFYNWALPVTQQVNTNTIGISANAGDITALQTQQKTNTTNIGALQTQQQTNTTNIGTIQTQQDTNKNNITAMQTQQKTNTSNISTNTTNIGALQTQQKTNTTDIGALQTQQQTNTTNIGTIQTQQKTNTSNIGTNTTNIGALQTQQKINTSDISTINTTAIPDLQSKLSALIGPNGTIQTSINNATQPLQTNFSTLFGSITPTQDINEVIASNLNAPVPTSSETNLQNAISAVITNALSSTNSTPAAANLQTAVQTVVQSDTQGQNGVWYANSPDQLKKALIGAAKMASENNPQTVKLALGNYPLSSSLNIPSYVTLKGEGKLATQLIANNGSASFYPVVMNPGSELENLSVVNNAQSSAFLNAIGLDCTSSNSNSFTLSRVFVGIPGNQGYGNALQFFDSNLPPNESTQAVVNLNIDSSDFSAFYFLNNASSVLAPLSSGSSIFLLNNKILQVGYDTGYDGCQIMDRNPPGLFVQGSTHYIIGNAGQRGTGSGEMWVPCGA